MNKSEHLVAGSLVAAGTYLTLTYCYNEKPTLKGFLLSLGGGAIMGILPDIMEPANDCNHRSFFHSIAFAVLLGYAHYKQNSSENLENSIKVFFGVLGSAYASHLALDSMTPKGLPILMKEI